MRLRNSRVWKYAFMIGIVIAWLGGVDSAFAESPPPDPFIDKNQQLIDGCIYRKWNVKQTTLLFVDKNISSPQVTVLYPGNIVQAITGDVHSHPARIIVTKRHKGYQGRSYNEGEQLYALTYAGAGWYRLWHQGEIVYEDVSQVRGFFSRAVDDQAAWGVLIDKLQMEWWVQVRTADGQVGWSNEAENFGNKTVYEIDPIYIVADQKLLQFPVPPYIDGNTVMVPMKMLTDYFGAKATWDDTIKMASVLFEGTTLKFINNSKIALVDEKPVNLGVRVQLKQGYLYVPVRFFCENMGAEVSWDAETKQVKIERVNLKKIP